MKVMIAEGVDPPRVLQFDASNGTVPVATSSGIRDAFRGCECRDTSSNSWVCKELAIFWGTLVLLFGHVLPQGPKGWRLRNSGETLIPTE